MSKQFFYLTIFFPSITFGILPAEIFPWALIFSLFHLPIIYKNFFIICLVFIPATIIGILNSPNEIEIIRSLFAFLNAVLIFFVVINIDEKNFNFLLKILIFVIVVTIIFSIFQHYYRPIFDYWKYIVPRSNIYTDPLQMLGKGVAGFSSEPSRQAIELVLIYSVFISITKINIFKKIIFDLILFAFLIYFNRSATGLFFFFIYLITYLAHSKWYHYIYIFLIAVLLFLYLPFQDFNFRGISVINNLIDQGLSKDTLYNMIIFESGTRGSAILSILLNPTLFGYGIGNWALGMIDGLNYNPFLYLDNSNFIWFCQKAYQEAPPCGIRGNSYFTSIILEAGWLLALFLVTYLFFQARSSKVLGVKYVSKFNNFGLIAFLPTLFSLFLLGDTGNPIPFICLAILSRIYINK